MSKLSAQDELSFMVVKSLVPTVMALMTSSLKMVRGNEVFVKIKLKVVVVVMMIGIATVTLVLPAEQEERAIVSKPSAQDGPSFTAAKLLVPTVMVLMTSSFSSPYYTED